MIKLKDIYKTILENSGMSVPDGEPDTGFLPKGTVRKLGDYNKPDKWFDGGGYTQLDFPVADDIFGPGIEPDFEVTKTRTPEEGSLVTKQERSGESFSYADRWADEEITERVNLKDIAEAIAIPIEIGDTVLGGKFKNKRIVVKTIGKNEKGDITINGRPLLKFRILPKVEEGDGLWANIRAKRKRGEKPAHKNSKAHKDAVKAGKKINEGKTLSIFDFDDTLATADAWIYIKHKDGKESKLDPAEFAVYKDKPGDEYDFRDFDKMLKNPKVIKKNFKLLVKQIEKARKTAGRKVTILTARRLGFPVKHFFKTLRLDVYVVPVASADPQKKVDWIEAKIKGGYDTVYFMDDSKKNITAVNKLLKKYPHVKNIVKHIDGK
jgi:hypothetical protein